MNNKCFVDLCLCTRRQLMNYGLLFLAKHSNGTRWCQSGTNSTFLFTFLPLFLNAWSALVALSPEDESLAVRMQMCLSAGNMLKYDGKGVEGDVRDGLMCHTLTYMSDVNDLSHREKESGIWIRERVALLDSVMSLISVASVVLLHIQTSADLKRRTINNVGSRRGCGCVLHPSSRNSLHLSSRTGSVCVWSHQSLRHNVRLRVVARMSLYGC